MTKPNPCNSHCACVPGLLKRVNELEAIERMAVGSLDAMTDWRSAAIRVIMRTTRGEQTLRRIGREYVEYTKHRTTMKGASDAEG